MEQAGLGEPLVRPKNTIKAFFKYFRCNHHWVWSYPGDGRDPWRRCSFCKWRMDI